MTGFDDINDFLAPGIGGIGRGLFGPAPDANELVQREGQSAVGKSIVWVPERGCWATGSPLTGLRSWDLINGRFVEC